MGPMLVLWLVGGAEWGRGSIGAMIGGWRLGTTSELIIALPTAYITTVAVSVRSNGVYIFFSMISTL